MGKDTEGGRMKGEKAGGGGKQEMKITYWTTIHPQIEIFEETNSNFYFDQYQIYKDIMPADFNCNMTVQSFSSLVQL